MEGIKEKHGASVLDHQNVLLAVCLSVQPLQDCAALTTNTSPRQVLALAAACKAKQAPTSECT